MRIEKKAMVLMARQNPNEYTAKEQDSKYNSNLSTSTLCNRIAFHLAEQSKSANRLTPAMFPERSHRISSPITKGRQVFVKGYSNEKILNRDKSPNVDLTLMGSQYCEPPSPKNTGSRESLDFGSNNPSTLKLSTTTSANKFITYGLKVDTLFHPRDLSTSHFSETKSPLAGSGVLGYSDFAFAKRASEIQILSPHGLKSPVNANNTNNANISTMSATKPGTPNPKKHSDKLATMLNLMKQNKRKNQLVSLIYQNSQKQEMVPLSIQVPNKREVIKMNKARQREQKKQLKVRGSNNFDLLKYKIIDVKL